MVLDDQFAVNEILDSLFRQREGVQVQVSDGEDSSVAVGLEDFLGSCSGALVRRLGVLNPGLFQKFLELGLEKLQQQHQG